MSIRREIEARLVLFDELSGILGAMRSFALAELRRVVKREAAQQQVVQALAEALNDVADILPETSDKSTIPDAGKSDNDIWLLFGSVRGFCGSFNEDVMAFWRNQTGEQGPLILLGERLHTMVGDRERLQCVDGAEGSLDAATVIDRILTSITELRGNNDQFSLWACIRDEQGARGQRLWPLPVEQRTRCGYPPLTHAPLTDIAANITEHYLFHSLLALLLRSIKVENHMRLIQMETALRHLEKGVKICNGNEIG